METHFSEEQSYQKAVMLYEQLKSFDEIKIVLENDGLDKSTIEHLIHSIKAIHYAKKRKIGTNTILAGIIFLLIGFIATFACFHSNLNVTWAMFSFTSLGLIIIFIGLIYIFG